MVALKIPHLDNPGHVSNESENEKQLNVSHIVLTI